MTHRRLVVRHFHKLDSHTLPPKSSEMILDVGSDAKVTVTIKGDNVDLQYSDVVYFSFDEFLPDAKMRPLRD